MGNDPQDTNVNGTDSGMPSFDVEVPLHRARGQGLLKQILPKVPKAGLRTAKKVGGLRLSPRAPNVLSPYTAPGLGRHWTLV